MPTECFRFEWVKCGKPTCKSCPHGPYWYAYWREGKRVRKRYVGKSREFDRSYDRAEEPRFVAESPAVVRTQPEALKALGLHGDPSYQVAKTAWRIAAMKAHPDRGGTAAAFVSIQTAWEVLRRWYGWK
jgi:hypothetical protein